MSSTNISPLTSRHLKTLQFLGDQSSTGSTGELSNEEGENSNNNLKEKGRELVTSILTIMRKIGEQRKCQHISQCSVWDLWQGFWLHIIHVDNWWVVGVSP